MSKFDPYEHLKIIKNKDGTLTRLMSFPEIPPTGDTLDLPTGQTVASKDVPLDPQKNTYLRIFRPIKTPSNNNQPTKLPLIIYFHAGGWINFQVSDALNHETMNKLSDTVPAIVVSVNYRLAPETKLPGQYDDAFDALTWVKNQALDPHGDPWVKLGDFSRVYLYGISCGANIVLHTALRVVKQDISPLTIGGIILSQPLIGGKKRTKSELKLAADTLFPLPVIDLLWELALPDGTDRDHRYCNLLGDGFLRENMRGLGRCLVIGFGGDPLIDRQQELVQVMVMQGVMVEARFDDVGFHGIEIVDQRRANAILNFIKDFIGC